MADKHQFGGGSKGNMTCTDFDAQLMDALDGVLSGAELDAFRAHVAACLECAPVYQQAKRGMEMLKTLEAVEPPATLVHNILAQTTHTAPGVARAEQKSAGWGRRLAEFIAPGMAPALGEFVSAISFRGMMTPRFAMTAAMSFFSISMILNVAGFQLKDLRNLDLRPSAVATSASLQYHETTSKVIKYYENMRFVYEWESRLKSIKSANTEEDNQQEDNKKRPEDNSSEREKQRQEKDVNYSLQQSASFLAVNFINAPVSVPETGKR